MDELVKTIAGETEGVLKEAYIDNWRHKSKNVTDALAISI